MTPLQDFDMGAPPPEDDEPLDLPTGDELIASLNEIDVAGSLLVQYQQAVRLRRLAMEANDAPFNQRAQVLNAVSAILAQLVKLRTELYNSERMKRIEGILLSCLKELPKDAQTAFMEQYRRELLVE